MQRPGEIWRSALYYRDFKRCRAMKRWELAMRGENRYIAFLAGRARQPPASIGSGAI